MQDSQRREYHLGKGGPKPKGYLSLSGPKPKGSYF